jgi:hypothetical protein
VIGHVKALVETLWGWRSFEFGPPTGHYTSTVMARTHVEWRQLGASIRWDPGEDADDIAVRLGPLVWSCKRRDGGNAGRYTEGWSAE